MTVSRTTRVLYLGIGVFVGGVLLSEVGHDGTEAMVAGVVIMAMSAIVALSD